MTPLRIPALVFLTLSFVLSACGQSSEPGDGQPPDGQKASTATFATPNAEPTPTLSAQEQAAFDAATHAVLEYRQIIADLYSGARSRINDIDGVTSGELRSQEQANVSIGLREGYRSEPKGVRVVLERAEPLSFDLGPADRKADAGKADASKAAAGKASAAKVVVRACVDASAGWDVRPDGSRVPGVREQLDYTVVSDSRTGSGSWLVAGVKAQPDAGNRGC